MFGLGAWAAVLVAGSAALLAARRSGDPAHELSARRRLAPLAAAEHVTLVLGLGAGLLLMALRGWGLGHARWLAVKIGLTAFVIVPLEGMHAWISHVWIARGLRQTPAPPFSKDLARGIGMDGMVRTLMVPLLGLAVPLLIWLSFRRPG